MKLRHLRAASVIDLHVREGSWLCENANTLNRDRRSYSSNRQADSIEIELKNIILRRVSIFELGSKTDFVGRSASGGLC
jgi:hypothetical protein